MSFAKLAQRSRENRRRGICISCTRPAEDGRVLCAEHLQYHRTLKRELRAEKRARGICFRCDRIAAPFTLCLEHGAANYADVRAHRERRIAARAARRPRPSQHRRLAALGLCTSCREPASAVLCPDCRARRNELDQERRAERRVLGVCKCGRRSRRGYATCERCAAVARRANDRRRARFLAAGLCFRCGGGPQVPGRKDCAACRDRLQRGKKRLARRRARMNQTARGVRR